MPLDSTQEVGERKMEAKLSTPCGTASSWVAPEVFSPSCCWMFSICKGQGQISCPVHSCSWTWLYEWLHRGDAWALWSEFNQSVCCVLHTLRSNPLNTERAGWSLCGSAATRCPVVLIKQLKTAGSKPLTSEMLLTSPALNPFYLCPSVSHQSSILVCSVVWKQEE